MVGCLSSKQSVSVRFRLAVYSLVLYINKEYIIIVEKPPDPRCAYYGCEARSQLAWRSRIKKKNIAKPGGFAAASTNLTFI